MLRGVLRAGSWLYGAVVRVRNQGYDRGWLRHTRLPCVVISVGNLSVGGTGKTTCVEYLAAKLKQLEMRVGILSRGYGGETGGPPYWFLLQEGELLINGRSGQLVEGLPDEPQLLASHLPDVPVIVGAKREDGGRLALSQFHTGVLLLDDGFQHRQLARDCDIVLVNARMPMDGWPLLPRGPMREPLSSLRRAHVIIITKADQSLDRVAALQERLKSFNPDAVIATAIHEPNVLRDWRTGQRLAMDHLADSRVALLSSIGDPEGFEQTIRGLGTAVTSHLVYPDHHRYTEWDWQEVRRGSAAAGASAIVTTEKDLIRLRPFRRDHEPGELPVWVLDVRMRLLSGEEQVNDRLAGVCAR